ncbi:type IV secretion system protein [Kocuria rosea]|uniref:type IV secretion system protein n=1 Tax=Kocuria rosea TaxID=1275 RepID=UPI002B240810|nr:type IV secretion system protein [Kocuria rosea]MEB2528728.1 type IV secretion system protein [Kocuria rosea]MEB2619894.1 type IV secretion system protein [Kocuria rosea]
MAEEESCGRLDLVCNTKEGISDALTGAAGDALDQIADGVTSAVVETIASLGSMWTTVGSASLTSENGGAAEAPVRGAFNDQVDLLLSYASWIGLGVCVFGVLFLGIVLATNARRGDGAGLVNTATVLASGAALIGGATSLIGFLVPARAGNLSGSVGFIQDQTFYLTLAVAALSVMIAGAQMAWTQRAEPARDLLKNLLTLAVVTASGVTILNVLVAGTDALAVQIIDSAIGEDFQTDVLKLLALDNATSAGAADPVWLGGNVILIIVGGVVAIIVNLIQLMLMVLRTGMLFLMAGILPLSAAFLNTETGKSFFQKVIAWTLAFAFYKPAAALIYGLAIKMSTTGVWEDSGSGLIQFAAGLMMIVASVFALPVLVGFLSPVLGSMSSSGGSSGGALGIAAMGAAIPQGASHLARSGRGFGSDSSSTPPSKGGPGSAPAGPSSAAGGASGTAGASAAGTAGSAGTAAAGAAAAPVAAGMAAANAVQRGGEAVSQATESSAKAGTSSTGGSTGGTGAAGASATGTPGQDGAQKSAAGTEAQPAPGTGAVEAAPRTGARPTPGSGAGAAPPRSGARPTGPTGAGQAAKAVQQQARAFKAQIANETGNEGRPDGADRS